MQYFVVDAFTDVLFRGNPAGVCLLDKWLPDQIMQQIAAENNLAETAFVVKRDLCYHLRWFTPEVEIDLCGHATLASAYVIANFIDPTAVVMEFQTMSGLLTVHRVNEEYEMDFPARKPQSIQAVPGLEKALGVPVIETHQSRDLLVLVSNEQQVRGMAVDMALLNQIPDCFGVIVTARGDEADFVSRYFIPNASITEDPVTGSAHATLIPFWAERLGKDKLLARQLSQRGGTLHCEYCGHRVKIGGKAILYLQGRIRVS